MASVRIYPFALTGDIRLSRCRQTQQEEPIVTNKIHPLKGCETLPPMLSPEPIVCHRDRNRHDAPGQPKPKGRRRGSQRFTMLNTFMDCTLATIPRTDALVWLVLFRDARGNTARSAQTYIARRSGLCKRTVGTAIKRLERAGLLEVLYQGGINRGLSVYRIRPLAEGWQPAQMGAVVGANDLRPTQKGIHTGGDAPMGSVPPVMRVRNSTGSLHEEAGK